MRRKERDRGGLVPQNTTQVGVPPWPSPPCRHRLARHGGQANQTASPRRWQGWENPPGALVSGVGAYGREKRTGRGEPGRRGGMEQRRWVGPGGGRRRLETLASRSAGSWGERRKTKRRG
jgi:hypothetical protein